VNYALNGLSSTANPKYEMVLQLYNLQCDGGSTYTLQDIKTKFFTIDEKVAWDKTLTRIASGNSASARPNTSTHKLPEAKAIICFKCRKPGHKSPACPQNRKQDTSVGAQATTTTKDTLTKNTTPTHQNTTKTKHNRSRSSAKAEPAIVCAAQVINLSTFPIVFSHEPIIENECLEDATTEQVRTIVSDDNKSRYYLNVSDKFVTISFDVFDNLNAESNYAAPAYLLVIHDAPFEEDIISFARLFTVDLTAPRTNLWRELYKQAFLPGLARTFHIHPSSMGYGLYEQWHDICHTIILSKLEALAMDSTTRTVLITTTDSGIQVTFYPNDYHRPILHYVTSGDFYYVTHKYTSFWHKLLSHPAPQLFQSKPT